MLPLLDNWDNIEADTIYQTSKGRFVSFSKTQIELGKKYDSNNKHLKAIEKGEVPLRGHIGLVPSQEPGYSLKSKVLGKGGNYRFHGKYIAQSIKLDDETASEQLYMIFTLSRFNDRTLKWSNFMELSIHQLWNNLEKLSSKSLESIGKEHLEYSNYKVFGYWDEKDKFYDEITFKQPLGIELSSYSIGKTLNHVQNNYWIKLQFTLKILTNHNQSHNLENSNPIIGEMTLILDPNFQFIDENWLIDINSPFIITQSEPN